eukprot:1062667-Amphidinium_carterae.1
MCSWEDHSADILLDVSAFHVESNRVWVSQIPVNNSHALRARSACGASLTATVLGSMRRCGLALTSTADQQGVKRPSQTTPQPKF